MKATRAAPPSAQHSGPDAAHTLRIATYNIHKCRGIDRKTSPARIRDVLLEIDADVICLQEVVDAPGHSRLNDQANFLAENLPGMTAMAFGNNRSLHGGGYGNLTLTRFRLLAWENHNLTARREPRGALRTEIAVGSGPPVQVFNIHLGTGFRERRTQAHLLAEMLAHTRHHGPRIVLGDFNEWTHGLTTRLLRSTFSTAAPRHALGFPRTFPGLLPLLTLDHCYFEPPLELVHTVLHRSPTALIASDHLPLVATFRIPQLNLHHTSMAAASPEEQLAR